MLTADARRGPSRSTSVPAITLLNTTNAWVFAEDPIKPNATQAIVHLGLAQLERLILTLDENTLADTGMIVGFAVAARINPLVARARHVDNLGRFELGLLRGGRGHHGGLQEVLQFRRLNVHAHRFDEFLQRKGEPRLLDADLRTQFLHVVDELARRVDADGRYKPGLVFGGCARLLFCPLGGGMLLVGVMYVLGNYLA